MERSAAQLKFKGPKFVLNELFSMFRSLFSNLFQVADHKKHKKVIGGPQ